MSRWIDADKMLADESEAYMKAQIELAKQEPNKTYSATRMVNAVAHKKIQMLIADTPSIDIVRCAECHWARPRTLKGETGYRCVFYRVDKAESGYCDNGEREGE